MWSFSQTVLLSVLTFSLKGGNLWLLCVICEVPASLPLHSGDTGKKNKSDLSTGTVIP